VKYLVCKNDYKAVKTLDCFWFIVDQPGIRYEFICSVPYDILIMKFEEP